MTLPASIVREILRNLAPFKPLKVILFGSYAKGSATEDSDIDLLVVLPGVAPRTRQERKQLWLPVEKALLPINYEYAMDIIVYSEEDYRKLKAKKQPFLREIESTGRVLYEKRL
jgi:predicted nucleotidyltransferase